MTLHTSTRGYRSLWRGLHNRSRNLQRVRHVVTLGIRREDPQRIWERRAPLTPDTVRQLKEEEGVEVLVQPCERRVFTMDEYLKAGAKAHTTLEPAHILLGIKETPLNELLVEPLSPQGTLASQLKSRTDGPLVPRTQIMFSHTIKGQSYNMLLLARFLDTKHPNFHHDDPSLLPTLIDYELLTDSEGKRTVGFGWFAGVAGALEGLVSTAHLFLELGVFSAFLQAPRPHTAPLSSLRASIRQIGQQIATQGMPGSTGPFVIGVTGTGQVTKGALALLSELPVQMVKPDELQKLVLDPATPLNKVYVVHATPDTYLRCKDGGKYDRASYYSQPDAYESTFHEHIAPYLSLLINGIGWSPAYPRLMSTDQLILALSKVEELHKQFAEDNAFGRVDGQRGGLAEVMKGRCRSFADISCDVEGGLEFLSRTSTLTEPFFSHRPDNFPAHLPSLCMMSVDILPTSLPLDASESFSKQMVQYLVPLIHKYKRAFEGKPTKYDGSNEYEVALQRAVVAEQGKLTEKQAWLQERVTPHLTGSSSAAAQGATKKNVLMLGSGMVAGPAVDTICSEKNVNLVIGSNIVGAAQQIARKHDNAKVVGVDVTNMDALDRLVKDADVVISLLPVKFHASVAELCIKNRVHMVTASYVSPEMRALHQKAVDADVLILNEIGLDPGIDHCSALSLLDSLRSQKKEIRSFVSFCGGLPSPQDADVPLRYRFSWSPRGVLAATLNDARFLLMDKERRVGSNDLLKTSFPNLPISNILKFEGIANRDSTIYSKLYGLDNASGLRTLFRGTLRYPGFCSLMQSFKDIGLLETEQEIELGSSWQALPRLALAARLGVSLPDSSSFNAALNDALPSSAHAELLEALEWLGFTSDDPHFKPQAGAMAPIDFLAAHLANKLAYNTHKHKMAYGRNETDMVYLQHEITVDVPQVGGPPKQEIHVSELQCYSEDGESAMSRTVGVPVALAALKVLDGGLRFRGVQLPTDPELYTYILNGLSGAGMTLKETIKRGPTVEAALAGRFSS